MMKSTAKKIANVLALFALCLTLGLCALACGGKDDPPPKKDPVPPVKVSDGIDFEVATGKSKNLTVADYITVNDYVPSAESDSENATATIAQGLLTVTGVSEGSATVTLSCGDITVTFGVSVFAAYTVTVDGVETDVRKGGTFVLPEAPVIADGNFEFDYWLVDGEEQKAPGDEITVNSNITVTSVTKRKAAEKIKDGITVNLLTAGSTSMDINVSDYITTHGNDVSASSQDSNIATAVISTGKLTITAVAAGTTTVTLTCGDVTVTFDVSVVSADDNAPVFKNGTISFDLYEKTSDSYDFEITEPEGSSFTYEYTVTPNTGVSISGNTLNYTATAAVSNLVLDVSVTATDATIGTRTASFTVTVNVIDTTEYRMVNGDFENGLDGWTLSNAALGAVNSATMYWKEMVPFNATGKFFNAYVNFKEDDANVAISGDEGAKGTLTSPTFTIGGSGWITYKIGAAKDMTLVYIEIIDAETQNVLDRFGNELFNDSDLGGCKLIAYKANLSAHDGKKVYVRITDKASANYGLFFADEFVTYYAQKPGDEFNTATSQINLKYQVANGGFENSNLDGWTLTEGEVFAKVSNDNKYFAGVDYGKDGDWLLTGAAGGEHGSNPDGLEGKKGVLRSDNFILKQNTWISFKLGGGNSDNLGIRIVKADGTVLAVFKNSSMNAAEGSLVQYVYQFKDMTEDVECYVEIFDNQESSWGLVTVDSIVTYYDGEPIIDGAVKVD